MLKVLVLTNDRREAPAPGMRDGYTRLVSSGELDSVRFVSWAESTLDVILSELGRCDWELLVVWSPRSFPSTASEMAEVDRRIAGRRVVISEGDHWNAKRVSTAAKDFWLPRASDVFGSAGPAAMKAYLSAGAERIHTTISGYDQVRFADAERDGPPPMSKFFNVCMIGSNPRRMAGKIVRPGAVGRQVLAYRLRLRYGGNFSLYGSGWPSVAAAARLPFEEQVRTIGKHSVSAIWDHYPNIPMAFSNRMAISLLAGRPHVMSFHPDARWLDDMSPGLFMERSPSAALARVEALAGLGWRELADLGEAAFFWSRFRLSQAIMVRYMFSVIDERISGPSMAPWTGLRVPERDL